ncbi:MAG: M20/M25/M40 family metallo-hydrolase [Bacteroidales bacterium]|nr:M20/M25/M40 family metallo-hydrolase [Bacteroidales bacterium]
MNKIQVPVSVVLLFLVSSCQVYRYSPEITESDLHKHIQYLASDALQGRYPGTKGDVSSGKYLERQLQKMQLSAHRQAFSFVQSYTRGHDNMLEINGKEIPASGYTPVTFSKDTLLSAAILFAGYGLSMEADSFRWNDYEGLTVKDKWVLVLRGIPNLPEVNSLLAMGSDDRDKAMLARDNGAAGIILVSGPGYDASDQLPEVSGKQASAGIPVLQVTRSVADILLSPEKTSVQKLEAEIQEKRQPLGFLLPGIVKARTDIEAIKAQTSNWYAVIEGSDPSLKEEYVVVGAHYDHLGMGGPGSSSRRQDTIAVHNGADDNASGVAALLEIAGKLKQDQSSLRRSVLVVAFGAEEMGLLGSKHFVDLPPVPLNRMSAMVNLDMVGRLDTLKGIQIGGTGTSAEADSLIKISNHPGGFRLSLNREGSGPSDHSSFYGKNIPVFFITTGAHTDYHTPDDDIGHINFQGLKQVTDFTYRLILGIDRENGRLTFREAGPRESPTPNYRFKVTLGFMPDFSSTDVEGVRVDFVSKGKAAERGGILKGDIIIAIDGLAVKNIYDYMYRLSKLSKNQIITVELVRNGQNEVLIIQL